jgi:26S proteasome regulatory subunit T5
MFEQNVRIMKQEYDGWMAKKVDVDAKIKDNAEKIKMNKQLPYLVSNVIEILDLKPEEEDDGGAVDLNSQRSDKCVVIKTSTRQTVFLPVCIVWLTNNPKSLHFVNLSSYVICCA